WYYVTICTKDRKCYFGNVVNGEMELSEIGKVAEKFLSHIPKHFPNMNVDEFVVMPNHIHAIIVIENKRRDVACNVSTNPMSIISPKIGSLSTTIRSYKSTVTKFVRNNINKQFVWQPRFYEHIIRNEKSLFEIRKYIELNTMKWELDKENPINN
ncbi:MAG: transposase, partial [Ignavibacteriae bacterium]|nr:transposase [Ignavibacteriota bacterium]